MKLIKSSMASVFAICIATSANAQSLNAPNFANIFGDNAIIQRDRPINIWGNAKPNTELKFQFGETILSINSNDKGKWNVQLPAMSSNANGINISISDGTNINLIKNILIGDVFLCSGQSNMEFTLKYETNAEQNMINGGDNLLRFFNVPKQTADNSQDEFKIKSTWEIASPNTIGNTSAVCFSMAQDFRRTQNIPIGFINSTWGGTKIETWMSEETLAKREIYKGQLEQSAQLKLDPQKASKDWGQNNYKFWEANEANKESKSNWRAKDFDDKSWNELEIGNFWEKSEHKELEQFDGLAWYRVSFNLTKEQAKNAIAINLGPIDDMDNLFINGQFIGATDGWDTKRNYKIPNKILKTGKNTIALRIFDGGGGGGLWGDLALNNIALKNGEKILLPTKWKYKISSQMKDTKSPPPSSFAISSRPSTIYNAMISPLKGLSFKGVGWYQGEANIGLDKQYQDASNLWMQNWREIFNDTSLAFGIVQLSSFGPASSTPVNSAWAALRNSQLKTVIDEPRSAMAASIDIGDRYDIHPTQKQILGVRLAKSLGSIIYNNGYSRTGPIPTKAFKYQDKIRVSFANLDGALVSYSAKYPPAVELCDINKCEFAISQTNGENLDIEIPNDLTPIKVRYAWGDSVFVTLYSKDDLPIPTFEMEIK